MRKIIIKKPEKVETINLEAIPEYANFVYAVKYGSWFNELYVIARLPGRKYCAINIDGGRWDDGGHDTVRDAVRDLLDDYANDFECWYLHGRKEFKKLMEKCYG